MAVGFLTLFVGCSLEYKTTIASLDSKTVFKGPVGADSERNSGTLYYWALTDEVVAVFTQATTSILLSGRDLGSVKHLFSSFHA